MFLFSIGNEEKVPHFSIGKPKQTKSYETPEVYKVPKWQVISSEVDEEFQKFWAENAEKIVMQKWKEKYGEYMAENEAKSDNAENHDEKENEHEIHSKSWDELWQEHWNQIHTEEYEKFAKSSKVKDVTDDLKNMVIQDDPKAEKQATQEVNTEIQVIPDDTNGENQATQEIKSEAQVIQDDPNCENQVCSHLVLGLFAPF